MELYSPNVHKRRLIVSPISPYHVAFRLILFCYTVDNQVVPYLTGVLQFENVVPFASLTINHPSMPSPCVWRAVLQPGVRLISITSRFQNRPFSDVTSRRVHPDACWCVDSISLPVTDPLVTSPVGVSTQMHAGMMSRSAHQLVESQRTSCWFISHHASGGSGL